MLAQLWAVTQEDTPLASDLNRANPASIVNTLHEPARGRVSYGQYYSYAGYTYVPEPGFFGVDSFTASLNYQGIASETTVTIRVLPADSTARVDTIGIDGQLQGTNVTPTGAVGPDQIVEMTNLSYVVRDKTGTVLTRTSLDDFWNTALSTDHSLNEVQQISLIGLSADPDDLEAASFVLSYGPQLAQVVKYSSNAALFEERMQSALDNMFGVGNTKAILAVQPTAIPTYLDVIFCGELAGMPMQMLQVRSAGYYLRSQGEITSGSFTLNIELPSGTVTTDSIPFSNAVRGPATQGALIQQALDAALGTGQARVISLLRNDPYYGTIEFADPALQIDPPKITVDSSGLVGGTMLAAVEYSEQSNELHRLTLGGSPSGGSFTLTVDDSFRAMGLLSNIDDDSTFTTTPIAFSTDAAQTAANIQKALSNPTIFERNVVNVTAVDAFTFDIQFGGKYPTTNRREPGRWEFVTLTGDASGLQGGTDPTITATSLHGSGHSLESAFVASSQQLGVGSEVQRLSVAGASSGGTLALAYGPDLVVGLEWTNDREVFAHRLQAGLNEMFGAGNTRVFEVADGEFDIAF